MPQRDEQSLACASKCVVAVAEEGGFHENSDERYGSEWHRRCRRRAEIIRSGKLREAQHWQGGVTQKTWNAQLAHRKQKNEDERKHDPRSAEWQCDSPKNSRPSRYETSCLLETAIDIGRRRKRQEHGNGKED